MANSGVIENGIKLIGEAVIPGASLILDGDIKGGAGHAIVGLATATLLGPARLLVAANSFSKSVSEKHLHNHIFDLFRTSRDSISGTQSDRDSMADTTAEAAAPA